MARDGSATREKILTIANELVMQRGFAATSLDQILARAGVTKGAFFHHFRSKEELAAELFDRYLALEYEVIDLTLRRAEGLSNDPLQQILLALAFLEELFEAAAEPHPGCLIASFLYQNDLMDERTTSRSREMFGVWRDAFATKLTSACRSRAPRGQLEVEALAELPLVTIEGAMVLSRLYADPGIIPRSIRQVRRHIELVFGAEAPAESPS